MCATEMELLPPQIQDLGVLRRIIFASVNLPKDLPDYWHIVAEFTTLHIKSNVVLDQACVQTVVENLQLLNEQVFATDKHMIHEIHSHCPRDEHPLGIILHERDAVFDNIMGTIHKVVDLLPSTTVNGLIIPTVCQLARLPLK